MTNNDLSTLAHAYTIAFKIDDTNFTHEDFRAAYDGTIGRHIEAKASVLNEEMAKLLNNLNIEIPVHKGIAFTAGSGAINGSYHVNHDASLASIVSSVEEDLAAAAIPHGLVTISIYTKRDENPTHHFVMKPEEDVLTEVTVQEFYRIEIEAMGLSDDA